MNLLKRLASFRMPKVFNVDFTVINSLNTFYFDQALMKSSTDAMKESRFPDFMASVGPLTFMLKVLGCEVGFL